MQVKLFFENHSKNSLSTWALLNRERNLGSDGNQNQEHIKWAYLISRYLWPQLENKFNPKIMIFMNAFIASLNGKKGTKL